MTDPVLKFDGYAFSKLMYMRDHRPYEVTMFGVTKPEDPLHVIDMQLVKQVVESASSDCDMDYMNSKFLFQNLQKGIAPINCDRVWCHTHPMTGESSANPSGKDMGTWNHEDNALKNFMVMFILSRSGQMTCKLRVRTNLNKEVPGLNIPHIFEKDIKVEIIQSDEYKAKILAGLKDIFGEKAVERLGDKAVSILSPLVKYSEVFPEFLTLDSEYDELVSVYKPPVTTTYLGKGGGNYYGNFSTFRGGHEKRRKKASADIVPELLLVLSEHKYTFDPIKDEELTELKRKYDGIDDVTSLSRLEAEFSQAHPHNDTNYVDMIFGAMRGDLVASSANRLIVCHKHNDLDKRCDAVNGASMRYPLFKSLASKFSVGVE